MTTVWLHGAALSGARFGPDPDGLWPDLPGHGATARTRPDVASYAAALTPVLPERFALVGHSLGGMVAIQLASDLASRCRALVLVDVPLRMPFGRFGGLARRLAPGLARIPGPHGLASVLARRVERSDARPDVQRAISSMSVMGLRDAMIAACRFDAKPLLPRLTLPILAIFGTRSLLTSAAQRTELSSACPQAQIHVLEASHFTPFDQPEAFAALVTPFLEAHR